MKNSMGNILWIGALYLFSASLKNIRCQSLEDGGNNGVEDLICDSDFRSVRMQWHYRIEPEPIGFHITLCESAPWLRSKGDCFERHLLDGKQGTLRGHDSLISDGHGRYQAVLYDLRMLTNYTVKVEPMDDRNRLTDTKRNTNGRARLFNPAKIRFSTKGFSAHASNCLANTSDIVVHSGPYFGGKITVEGSSDDRCSVYGNRTSSKDIYILRIDHQLCGSKTVNDTRIDTVVVVHESSSVVTHNSRRFLVQCSFLPDTFTIKAAFNVPRESEDSQKKNFNYKQLEEALQNMDSNDVFTYEHYRQNHVKDSRMSSEQGPSVLHRNMPGYESQMLGLLIMIIVLVIVVVIVVGLGLWWYINSHRRRCRNVDIETMSTSGSSFLAYHAGDDDTLVRSNNSISLPNGDTNGMARGMNPFYGAQVALVSLKPVKQLY